MNAFVDVLETVLGLFRTPEDADHSVKKLLAAGFPQECVTILSHEQILDEFTQAGREVISSEDLCKLATETAEGMLGAMATLIISIERAEPLTNGMKQGGVLVVVHSFHGQGEIACDIMENTGAIRVEQVQQDKEKILLSDEY